VRRPGQADVTGQIFGVRNNEIFLFSQPRPVRNAHNSEGWTAAIGARLGPAHAARRLLRARPLQRRVHLGSHVTQNVHI
jgi:hypothetical protein